MPITYSKENLDNAIETCFAIFFSNAVAPKGKSLTNIINNNKENGSLYLTPRDVFLKVTSQCNLRCKHCFYYTNQKEFDYSNDFSTKELLSLLEFLVEELNVINFTITGGEPFLQKDILKILQYLKSKNTAIQIQTNATLINDKNAIEIAKIFNPKQDFIQVSLDGATAEIHDSIRGKGSFDKAVKGIKKLTDNGINVVVSHTITSKSIENLEGLYELCKDLKVKEISLSRFKICSDEQSYLDVDINQIFIETASLINKMKNQSQVTLKLTNIKPFDFVNYEVGRKLIEKNLMNEPIPELNNYSCHRHEKLSICADGRVTLCPQTEQEEVCLGNLKNKSLSEIWESRFDNIFFQKRDMEGSICKECKYLCICHAGCPSEAYCEYGKVNAPDGKCQYAKELVKKRNEENNYVS